MHSEILCFLDFLPFLLHKVTTSLRICCCIVVRSGWQCVSRTELCSSSCELPSASLSLSWNCRGLCKQTVIEISNQCNLHFFFSFFPQRKRKVMAGILTVCKKKTNCVGFGGMNCANMKTKIMQECIIL